jgi:hypothetical protein
VDYNTAQFVGILRGCFCKMTGPTSLA